MKTLFTFTTLLFLSIFGCGDSKNEEGEPSPSSDSSSKEAKKEVASKTESETSSETSTSKTESETSSETPTSKIESESTATSKNGTGSTPSSFKIAAFNADILGKAKMAKASIASYIADIITRYDVILIQEVRDVDEKTPNDLLSLVNAKNKGTYALSTSKRLGRTSSKEQYVFYFKKDSGLKVEKSEIYNDSSDIFEREPYIVKFSSGDLSFSLIGIHVEPDDAINELNQLDDVYNFATTTFTAHDTIILGDLNVDCSYVSDAKYQNLDLVKQGFTFSILKSLDTTVSNTNCAYDNIVSKSKSLRNASIFDFKTTYGLDQSTAESVSNHFPVEFDLAIKN